MKKTTETKRMTGKGLLEVVTCFSCEICGELVKQEAYEKHFQNCSKKKEKAELEQKKYLKKFEDRKAMATDWASGNEEVRLLCSHGYTLAARIICNEWARFNLWDCGTSSGWETLLDEMIEAARTQTGPGPEAALEIEELGFIENVEPKAIASKMMQLGWDKERVFETWTDICNWGQAVSDSYLAQKESKESGE